MELRRRPIPLRDLIPLLLKAADELQPQKKAAD
jgi:hypothetical protein